MRIKLPTLWCYLPYYFKPLSFAHAIIFLSVVSSKIICPDGLKSILYIGFFSVKINLLNCWISDSLISVFAGSFSLDSTLPLISTPSGKTFLLAANLLSAVVNV